MTDRSIRWVWALRPIPALIWLVVLLLPWVAAIVSRTGMSFFADSIGHDMLGKVAEGQETHGAPPGYYLVLFVVTFFPAAVLATLAAPRAWALRREPWVRFLLAWVMPAWIIFELVPTKLPHYVLPLYPAIAILIAEAVDSGKLSRNRWLVLGTVGWFLIPLILCGVAIAGLIYLTGALGLLAWPFALAAAVLGYLAWRRYEAEGAEAALLRAVGGQHPHGHCRRRNRAAGDDRRSFPASSWRGWWKQPAAPIRWRPRWAMTSRAWSSSSARRRSSPIPSPPSIS